MSIDTFDPDTSMISNLSYSNETFTAPVNHQTDSAISAGTSVSRPSSGQYLSSTQPFYRPGALQETTNNAQPFTFQPLPSSDANKVAAAERLAHNNVSRLARGRHGRRRSTVVSGSGAAERIRNHPSYRDYRARQRRSGEPEGEAKWPDEVEDAFLEGMF
jgi:hypothetical protein